VRDLKSLGTPGLDYHLLVLGLKNKKGGAKKSQANTAADIH